MVRILLIDDASVSSWIVYSDWRKSHYHTSHIGFYTKRQYFKVETFFLSLFKERCDNFVVLRNYHAISPRRPVEKMFYSLATCPYHEC